MNTFESLRTVFNPRSIALVGVSNRPGSVGNALLRNTLGGDFDGVVYPVNPKHRSMRGTKVYPTLRAIPDRVDLAIIATPSTHVLGVIEECGQCGIGNAVVITAGFLETGRAGAALFRKLVRTARQAGVRIIGPNCLGFIRPPIGLNASFAARMALPGKLAFISQSGALCTAVLDWSIRDRVGFSHFISIGSMADIGYHDLLDYLATDPGTSSILIYMESLRDAKRFISAARSIGRTKPIIVLKVGRSSEGAAAASSHTGSLTGDDAIYDAVFERAGVARVNTIKELFNISQSLSMQPRPRGNRLLIITNAGGPGVIATDMHIAQGGRLAPLSATLREKLNQVLPAAWSHSNPIDVLGDAGVTPYTETLRHCLDEPNVDGILVILTPQAMTNADEIGRALGDLAATSNKTILAAFMGAADVASGTRALTAKGIPVYDNPEEAVTCFNLMARYARNQELLTETPESVPAEFKPKTAVNQRLLARVRDAGRHALNENEAKQFIANYGLISPPHAHAATAADAARRAAGFGFPVAMKIMSPDILHKTDVNGVALNLRSKRAVMLAFRQITRDAARLRPKAQLQGVIVEKMVTKKYELFLGSKMDPVFGPVILFGAGGVGVEVFKDISIGIPPLNMALAKRMIEKTKIHTLLAGYRGMAAIDMRSLQFLLYRFSYMIMDFPEIAEMDINPLGVDADGIVALDAKIVLDPAPPPRHAAPYRHLIVTPYPRELERTVRLANRKTVRLRPIRPEDEQLEAEMFRAMSPQTQRFRFFELIKDISHEMLIRYTQIDYDREVAIVAEMRERGVRKMVGVARVIGDPYHETSEFAIVVADPWQGMGLGNVLTDAVLSVARQRKYRSIYADFLGDNHAMHHILRKRKFTFSTGQNPVRATWVCAH
ncbi:bifunctional acetate--CoA ligase family protein/GNAT family N-acetyltransferase [Synoicihabitans lomoniglobus]|uniref:Bifunctional acetate--CoA ligase family protein/GNAT family N-acetyltransferase n=1 Tax=Synoicihabitans lomoniglobus TaxID=2909285 RepID=A0AAF0CR74_9BACT|nr:bifunctional acetate--CoA ligase family protein/GNAT family N-acetyltransferase [Opitutaceae bacterium LMO-M01]